jgi:DNA polymerase-3 subunit beta
VKISLERDVLFSQLQTVSRVASTRSAIQALSGVQLVAAADGCELRATDMDVGLRVPLQAQVERDGTIVLPARLMLDVVRSLPAETVTLELRAAEQDVEITAGNATFHIRVLRSVDSGSGSGTSRPSRNPIPSRRWRSTRPPSSRPRPRWPARPRATRRDRC